MKKNLLKTVFLVALVFGFGSYASAENCTVQKGDSLWKISKRYNVRFSDLCRVNKHLRDLGEIYPYERVELPHGSEGESTNHHSGADVFEEKNETPRGETTSVQAEEVLRLVNNERSKNGLQPLTLSQKLTSIANVKAADMRDRNYFDHTSPTYGSPFEMLQHFGVTYTAAGENIAAGQKNAEAVMRDWLNSSGHRANILNKEYKELGVGYVSGGSYGTYWVQLFTK
jgi:uncharacterized YkwD family protein